MSESTATFPGTRIQVADDEGQVSQIGSVLEELQTLRMEEERRR
jgi:hypothetical protein